jgi:hypothetical protein
MSRSFVTSKGNDYFISEKCQDSDNLLEIEARKIISNLHPPNLFLALLSDMKSGDNSCALKAIQRLENIILSSPLLSRFAAVLQRNWLEDVMLSR